MPNVLTKVYVNYTCNIHSSLGLYKSRRVIVSVLLGLGLIIDIYSGNKKYLKNVFLFSLEDYYCTVWGLSSL